MQKYAALIIWLMIIILLTIGCPYTNNMTTVGMFDSWANRVQITIDHTKVSSSLINFPVLVHLSSASGTTGSDVLEVFNTLGSDSQKIAVTIADGKTQCYVEVVRWDDIANHAYLWVNVPVVSSISDTILYLYFDSNQPDNINYVGSTGSTPAQNVWDSNFVGVWHLGQSGNGTFGEFKDSTNKHNNGYGGGGNSSATPDRVDGPMGYVQNFDGFNDYISFPDDANHDFSATTTGALTISVWISPSVQVFSTATSPTGYIHWMGKGNLGHVEYQFIMYNLGGKGNDGGDRSQRTSFYFYSSQGEDGAGGGFQVPLAVNQWVYVTGTAHCTSPTSGGEDLWKDTQKQLGIGGDGDPWSAYKINYVATNSPFTIGRCMVGSGQWNGRMGEVRISNIVRSDAWIMASYYAEKDDLVSYGSARIKE